MNAKSKEQFLEINDLNLPNHENELSKAEDVITGLKLKIDNICDKNLITDELHDFYFEETAKILDYVGNLSRPVFNIIDDLEIMYVLKFPHSPQLAKKLWLNHYDQLHHPYSILKNRCHRLMDNLDNAYYKKFKKYPPNWEI